MKKLFALILVLLSLLLLINYAAAEDAELAVLASGYCGGDETAEYDSESGFYKNLSWALDPSGKVLTVSGTGAMADFEWDKIPWQSASDTITKVYVGRGVTTIGERAFEELPGLCTIEVSESVVSLGEYAFYNCYKLTDVYFSGNAPTVKGKSISFNNGLVVHCRSDKTGWTDSEAYDAAAGTWNGFKLEVSERERAVSSEELKITETGIDTDLVINYEGYGSIRLLAKGDENRDYDNGTLTFSEREPQYALINKNGELLFPYKSRTLGCYDYSYDSFGYVYSDGLVFESDLHYYTASDGVFYNTDGTVALTLGRVLDDYVFEEESDPDCTVIKSAPGFVTLVPFGDGVAFVREYISASLIYGIMGGVKSHEVSYLTDKDGNILYTFPDEANAMTWIGGEQMSYAGNLTKASEGLIGYIKEELVLGNEYLTAKDTLIGYMDYSGNTVLSLTGYEWGGKFSEGLAYVRNEDHLLGFIDKSGVEVIPCKYSDCYSFCDGCCAVKYNGKWGYIDAKGNTVIPFEYDAAYGSSDGMFSVCKDGKYGLVNSDNEVILPLEYDDISSCENGVVYAVKAGKLFVITPSSDEPDEPAVLASGYCGGDETAEYDSGSGAYKNLTWTLYWDGRLVIEGEGKMTDYPSPAAVTVAPWGQYSDKLKTLELKNGITEIGYGAFYGCTGFTGDLVVPESVTKIGECAFGKCSGFDYAVLLCKESVIHRYAFSGCSFVSDVFLKGTEVDWIKLSESRFAEAFGTVSVHCLYSDEWGTDPENGSILCGGKEFAKYNAASEMYYRTIIENDKSVIRYLSDALLDVINYYKKGADIISSGYCGGDTAAEYDEESGAYKNLTWALYDNGRLVIDGTGPMKDFEEVVLSEYAFTINSPFVSIKNNPYFHSLEIGGNVTTIGDNAFYGCGNIAGSLVIPDSVTSIGDGAFFDCYSLTGDIVMPSGLTSIGDYSFWGCRGLSDVYFTGNAPSVCPTTINSGSFRASTVLHYMYGTAGWTDSEAYDAAAGTWNGYKLVKETTVIASGYCGGDESAEYDSESEAYKNLTWTLCNDGNLIIEGDGKMMVYSDLDAVTTAPWGQYSDKLKALELKDGITEIGFDAFYGLTGLSGELVIPDSVTWIGNYAFYGCTGFTGELVIPDSVKYIHTDAFEDCTGFDGKLVLGNGLTEIGGSAFKNCTGLTGELVIPDSVESVGLGAFWNCSSLSGTVTIGKNVSTVGGDAFTCLPGITGFIGESSEYKTADGILYNSDMTKLICCPAGKSGEIVIPDTVTYINTHAFLNCKKLTGKLIFPASVEWIGWGVSAGSGFTSAYFLGNAPEISPVDPHSLPSFEESYTLYCLDGVTGWDDSEYYDETTGTWKGYKLGKWAVPVVSGYCGADETAGYDEESAAYKNLTWTLYTDGNLVIDGNGKMAGYERKEIPEDNSHITSAPWGVFADKLKSLEIRDGVTGIGDYAFCDCTGFSGDLDTGKNVTEIGKFAFALCSGFDGELKLSDTLKTVDEYAFWLCSGFTGSLELQEGITDIGKMAFGHCTGFTGKLVIPKSLGNIGYCAFSDMAGITGFVSRSANYKAVDGILYNSDATELILCPVHKTGELTIPDTVKIIGEWAFENCSDLTGSLVLPKGLTDIGQCAFYHCSGFTGSLVIPDSVVNIGNEAFYCCTGLTGESVIEANVRSIGSYAFDSCTGMTGLYFKGTAPFVDSNAFPAEFELTCLEGMDGWTDTEKYDADNSTWNGNKIKVIKLLASGYCGGEESAEYDSASEAYKNVTWSVYENGLLCITGKGAMRDYSCEIVSGHYITTAPWAAYADMDMSLDIDAGITKIGDYSFYGLSRLVSLRIVKYNPVMKLRLLRFALKTDELVIGKYAFCDCDSLTDIKFSENVTGIEEHAFENCTSLTGELELPEKLETIGSCAFKNVEKIETVAIPESVTEIKEDAFAGNEELTVCVPKGSYAETWAIENSVEFELKAKNVTVSGKVTSYNPNNVLTVDLLQGGEVIYSATVDALSGSETVTQDFSLTEVAAGTYDLVVKKAGHLSYTVTGVIVGEDDLDLTKSDKAYANMVMIAGDIDGDGKVNSSDWSILWGDANYLKSAEIAKNKLADINGDGKVNSTDWSILWSDANYLKTAEQTTVGY